MQSAPSADPTALPTKEGAAVLRLTVRHHPGAMLHVVSLLQRRNIRTGAFASFPEPDGRTCRMLVEIGPGERLDQAVNQLLKLEDVLEVTRVAEFEVPA